MNDKPILPKKQEEDRKQKGKGRKREASNNILTSIC